jgi:hypothetical protein
MRRAAEERCTDSVGQGGEDNEMALASAYVQVTGKIPDLFQKIRDGQAPGQFTYQLLKDWGLFVERQAVDPAPKGLSVSVSRWQADL